MIALNVCGFGLIFNLSIRLNQYFGVSRDDSTECVWIWLDIQFEHPVEPVLCSIRIGFLGTETNHIWFNLCILHCFEPCLGFWQISSLCACIDDGSECCHTGHNATVLHIPDPPLCTSRIATHAARMNHRVIYDFVGFYTILNHFLHPCFRTCLFSTPGPCMDHRAVADDIGLQVFHKHLLKPVFASLGCNPCVG